MPMASALRTALARGACSPYVWSDIAYGRGLDAIFSLAGTYVGLRSAGGQCRRGELLAETGDCRCVWRFGGRALYGHGGAFFINSDRRKRWPPQR